MDFDEINRILEIVRQHELTEFELEREGFKIRIKKGAVMQATMPPVIAAPMMHAAPVPAPAATPAAVAEPAATEAAPVQDEVDLAIVKSPIVGTFFRAPDPSAPSFVEVGDTVKKGQVLCIIEAMKLMNEIDSEYDGEIVKVYVENGRPVQYGERLFAIKARSDV